MSRVRSFFYPRFAFLSISGSNAVETQAFSFLALSSLLFLDGFPLSVSPCFNQSSFDKLSLSVSFFFFHSLLLFPPLPKLTLLIIPFDLASHLDKRTLSPYFYFSGYPGFPPTRGFSAEIYLSSPT